MITELWGTKPPKYEVYVDCKFEPVASTLILTIYFKLCPRFKVYLYPVLGLPSCRFTRRYDSSSSTWSSSHGVWPLVGPFHSQTSRNLFHGLPCSFMPFGLHSLCYPPYKGQWCVIL